MNETQQAIKRHDIDAPFFQKVYSNPNGNLNKKETVFLLGRKFVLEELENTLKKLPNGSKILDIGCGTAHLTKEIKDKGFDIIGIEPSDVMRNYANKNYSDIKILNATATNLPFENNSFDFILAIEVLRYLSKDENKKVYEEIYRTLKPNGRFFLTQVNLFSLDLYFFFYKIQRFLKKISNKFYHFTYFTTSFSEIQIAKNIGFSNISTIGVFSGSTRFFFKVNKNIGSFYWKFHSLILKRNRLENSIFKNVKAHLIVIGLK